MIWATFLLLWGSSFAFFAFAAGPLRDEFGTWTLGVALGGIFGVHAFLLLTWLVEPGILPVVEFEDAQADPEKPVKLVYIVIDGRYYDKRTFRAQSSRFTESCIEHFDHYCPWVGNAVGKRNYRYFVLFLVSVVALSAYVVGISIALTWKRSSEDNSVWQAAKQNFAVVAIAAFCGVLGLSLVCLLWYHVKMIARATTTLEDLKNKFVNGNPHDRGCFKNCQTFWCSPHWPSRVAHDTFREMHGHFSGNNSGTLQDVLLLNEALLFSPSTPTDTRGTPSPSRMTLAPSIMAAAVAADLDETGTAYLTREAG